MAYPGRQNIYEATIRRMVQEALEQQEQDFRQQHAEDSDEQLLAYLRAWAIRKQHTPGREKSSAESLFRSGSGPGIGHCSWRGSLLPKQQIKVNLLQESRKKQKSKRKSIGREKRKRRFWQTNGGFNKRPKRNTQNEFVLLGLCNPPRTSL